LDSFTAARRAEVLPVANRLARRADQEALMLRSKKQTAVAALHSWRHSLVQKGMSSIDAATFKPANASGRHLFCNSIAQDGSGQRYGPSILFERLNVVFYWLELYLLLALVICGCAGLFTFALWIGSSIAILNSLAKGVKTQNESINSEVNNESIN